MALRPCVLPLIYVLASPACRGTPAPAPPPSPAAAAPEPISVLEPPAPAPHLHDWNAIYESGAGFNSRPNALLAQSIEGVPPGKALDIGMGQGRNALFLSAKGWQVTGIDTAEGGLAIAKRNAAAAGLSIEALDQDMFSYDMGVERWDLVALIYMGDRKLSQRIVKALKPGGRVVVEFFHADADEIFPHPMNGYKTGELEQLFAGLEVVRSEVVEDVADFSERPAKLVRFVARKPLAAR